jgi:hypothetical protein
MTKVLDLNEKLLSQATKITKNENPNKKIVEKLLGCISKEKYEKMQKELSEMRNEWERNTY